MLISKHGVGLLYDGTNITSAVDYQESINFLKNNPLNTREDFSVFISWKKTVRRLPTNPSTHETPSKHPIPYLYTNQFLSRVLSVAAAGLISDYVLWERKDILQQLELHVDDLENPKHFSFSYKYNPLYDAPTDAPSTGQSDSDSSPSAPPSISLPLEKAGKYMILKDYLMHKRQPASFSSHGHSVTVGQEYEVTTTSSPASTLPSKTYKLPHVYGPSIRYALFNKALQSWNANPLNWQHKRDSLLQTWQMYAKLWTARRMVMLLPRRSGKSFYGAGEVIDEMLAINYRAGTRPRTILYLTKDFDAVGQTMIYITSLLKDFDRMKDLFKYDKKDHILYFYASTEDKKKDEPYSVTKFYSALGNLPGVGDPADTIIIDEAMYIPTHVKDGLMPIVINEWARLLVLSTFYAEDPEKKNSLYYRPVELCNQYEAESSKITDIFDHINHLADRYINPDSPNYNQMPDECVGLRFTVDDIDVIIDKDGAKEELASDPERYMRNLYCRYLEKETVFSYKPSILSSTPSALSTDISNVSNFQKRFNPKRTILSYDPAQTEDMSALLVSGYDPKLNKVYFFKEFQLNIKDKASFLPQADAIKSVREDCRRAFPDSPVVLVMDSTHQAISDVMASQRIPFHYLYQWVGWSANYQPQKTHRTNERRVPKRLMVEAAQHMFDNGLIAIDPSLTNLIHQLSWFVETKNYTTNISKYGNDKATKHDDFVTSMLYALWTYWEHFGLKRRQFDPPNLQESQPLDPTVPDQRYFDPNYAKFFPKSPTNQQHYSNVDFWFYY